MIFTINRKKAEERKIAEETERAKVQEMLSRVRPTTYTVKDTDKKSMALSPEEMKSLKEKANDIITQRTSELAGQTRLSSFYELQNRYFCALTLVREIMRDESLTIEEKLKLADDATRGVVPEPAFKDKP